MVEALRRSRGLSREELAALIGVTSRTLRRWASGATLPSRTSHVLRARLVDLGDLDTGRPVEGGRLDHICGGACACDDCADDRARELLRPRLRAARLPRLLAAPPDDPVDPFDPVEPGAVRVPSSPPWIAK
jgi:transcriptional regulator with XRE-family HTH domain